MTKEELENYNKKLLQSDIDNHNKIVLLSKKVNDLQKKNAELEAKWLQATDEGTSWAHRKSLEQENAELKEKFLTVKKDDVRKAKLNDCKTYEEKVEYLRQVTNYALFNDDISVMLWCFCQRGEIDTDQLTKATEIIKKLYAVYYDPCVTESDLKYRDELFAEIKQFLNSEVER